MDIEKMREEFEAHYAEEFSVVRGYKPSPGEMASMRDGDGYGSDRGYLNGYWKGWQASRAAIEVELPPYANTGVDTGGWPIDSGSHRVNGVIAKCRVAIESLGLKVRS